MQKLQFKNDFIPEINQRSYQSKGLCKGVIVKITKSNIYFDVGLKFLVKTSKRKFIKNFYKIQLQIEERLQQELSKEAFLEMQKQDNKPPRGDRSAGFYIKIDIISYLDQEF